jgi:hypothetical protein
LWCSCGSWDIMSDLGKSRRMLRPAGFHVVLLQAQIAAGTTEIGHPRGPRACMHINT